MSTVTVSLSGGLGNQLFQYAAGKALALRHGAELVLDLAWFDAVQRSSHITTRNYSLAPFGLSARLQNVGLGLGDPSRRLGRMFGPLLRRFHFGRNQARIYVERSFRYDPYVACLLPPVWLSGCWQSSKYFEDAAEIIRAEIGVARKQTAENIRLYQEIRSTDAICVHIRRGDYVENKSASQFHGLCSIDYYRSGLEIASHGLSTPHCYLFSDDPEWVSDNIRPDMETTIVDINGPDDAHFDLWLMAACKNFVIANSSLSWWAAWLGASGDNVVIAPKRWFRDNAIDVSDLLPSNWDRV